MALTEASLKPVSSNHGLTQWTKTFTQLTAAGSTDHIHVPGVRNHIFQLLLASSDTNVIVEIQGSHDGTNFGVLSMDNTVVTGVSGISANRATITADGTYLFVAKNVPTPYVRFTFVSESGGTAALLDVKYLGSE